MKGKWNGARFWNTVNHFSEKCIWNALEHTCIWLMLGVTDFNTRCSAPVSAQHTVSWLDYDQDCSSTEYRYYQSVSIERVTRRDTTTQRIHGSEHVLFDWFQNWFSQAPRHSAVKWNSVIFINETRTWSKLKTAGRSSRRMHNKETDTGWSRSDTLQKERETSIFYIKKKESWKTLRRNSN